MRTAYNSFLEDLADVLSAHDAELSVCNNVLNIAIPNGSGGTSVYIDPGILSVPVTAERLRLQTERAGK